MVARSWLVTKCCREFIWFARHALHQSSRVLWRVWEPELELVDTCAAGIPI